jgi:hypothetical protein
MLTPGLFKIHLGRSLFSQFPPNNNVVQAPRGTQPRSSWHARTLSKKDRGVKIFKVLLPISWEKGVKDSRIQGFKGLFSKDFLNTLSAGWLGVAPWHGTVSPEISLHVLFFISRPLRSRTQRTQRGVPYFSSNREVPIR